MPEDRLAVNARFPVYKLMLELILNSGLLLDEDLAILIENYEGSFELSSGCWLFPHKQILVAAMSAIGSIFVYHSKYTYYFWPFVLVVPTCINVGLFYYWRYVTVRAKRHLTTLVDALVKIGRLNRSFLEFLQDLRVRGLQADVEQQYSRKIKDCFQFIMEREGLLYQELLSFIRCYSITIRSQMTDFSFLEGINIDGIPEFNIDDIDNAILSQKKLNDMFLLLRSSLLTCLGLCVCPLLWAEQKKEINNILSNLLPKVTGVTLKTSKVINDKFNLIRFNFMFEKRGLDVYRDVVDKCVGDRLLTDTLSALALLNQMEDKAVAIFHLFNQITRENEAEKKRDIYAVVRALRNDSGGFHDALNLLCLIFDMAIAPTTASRGSQTPQPPASDTRAQGVQTPEPPAAPEDDEPPGDEQFEAYIPLDDAEPESVSADTFHDDEQSRRLAAALAQELKTCLTSHSTFLASRQKWGLATDDVQTRPFTSDEQIDTAGITESKKTQTKAKSGKFTATRYQGNDRPQAPTVAAPQNAQNTQGPPPPPPLPPSIAGCGDFRVSFRDRRDQPSTSTAQLEEVDAIPPEVDLDIPGPSRVIEAPETNEDTDQDDAARPSFDTTTTREFTHEQRPGTSSLDVQPPTPPSFDGSPAEEGSPEALPPPPPPPLVDACYDVVDMECEEQEDTTPPIVSFVQSVVDMSRQLNANRGDETFEAKGEAEDESDGDTEGEADGVNATP